MTQEVAVGWSALVAAAATVAGATTLVLFFARGEQWGRLNDATSVILMLTLVPVALLVARIEGGTSFPSAPFVGGIGIGAMLAVAILQALLVARLVTYEQTKRRVLLGSAVVGLWYLLIGLFARVTALDGLLAWLAIASGVGLIAVAAGFMVGNERHPLSAIGGGLALVASTAFLGLFGLRLVNGDIVAPFGNL